MLPFVQHNPNLPSSAPPGASAPQQPPGSSSNFLPNLTQVNSQMDFINPQPSMPYNNHVTHMGNGSRPPGFMNFPQFNALQNGLLGNSILGSAPQAQSRPGFGPQNFVQNPNVSTFPVNGQLGNLSQGNHGQFFGHNLLNVAQQLSQGPGFQNGQLGWSNQVQNLSQIGNMQMLNPSQVAALAQLIGCANQVAQQGMIPQTTAFAGNPQQLSLVQPTGVMLQNNMGQQLLTTSQHMQSATSNPQNSQSLGMRGNFGSTPRMHPSNPYQHRNKNFLDNHQRGATNQRFQKSGDQRMHNTKGKHKFSNKKGEKGAKSSVPENSANCSKSGKRRSLSMFYTEKEIRQWREARKKNFPSKANVEKKLLNRQANADAAVEEAELRRQQLKDVLAKQVELGFEVPEIPSHYLLNTENQCHGKDQDKKTLNGGRFQNRFNKKGKFDKNNHLRSKTGTKRNGSFKRREQFAKRRVKGDDSSKNTSSIRKPTLLQKLLSTEIERDKRRLLQALRFMVMNSFFKDWPEKPLNFPNVIVEELEGESEVIEQKPFSQKGELVGSIEDQNILHDSEGENDSCPEEGEIPE